MPDIAKLVEGYTGRKVEASSGETFDVAPMAIEARIQRPEPIGGIKLAFLPKKNAGRVRPAAADAPLWQCRESQGIQRRRPAFLPELMTQGTEKMTRQQIKDALDKNFARLGTGMGGRMMRGFGGLGVGSATFTLETKRANLPAVLEILRQILREPTLPASEFEIMKNENVAGLEEGRTGPHSPGPQSSPAPGGEIPRATTCATSRPSTSSSNRPRSSPSIRSAPCIASTSAPITASWWSSAISSPPRSCRSWARRSTGGRPSKPYARIERPIQPGIKAERETIETPDKANAVFLAGLQTPLKDSDPDYPDMVAGNYILGGGALSSRIADRLRQKGGLSYTAMSMFSADPFDPHAALMILAIYNPINVEKVVTGVDEEVHRLLRDGVKPDELDKAKTGFLQQLQIHARRDDPVLASLIAENLYVGRTMRFQAEFEQKIKELKPEAVNAALRKHIDPKRLSVVTAGDFKKKGSSSE